EPLVPGERYVVQVKLNGAAQQIPVGHRLRVAISTSYWPLAWPPPRPVRLTILPRRSRLLLPQRISGADGDAALLPFGDPEGSEPIPLTTIRPGEAQWTVTRDLVRYASRLEVVKDEGTFRLEDIDLAVTRRAHRPRGPIRPRGVPDPARPRCLRWGAGILLSDPGPPRAPGPPVASQEPRLRPRGSRMASCRLLAQYNSTRPFSLLRMGAVALRTAHGRASRLPGYTSTARLCENPGRRAVAPWAAVAPPTGV